MNGNRHFPFVFRYKLLVILLGFFTTAALSNDPAWDLCIERDPRLFEINSSEKTTDNFGELARWEGRALNLLARAVNQFSTIFDGWPLDKEGNPSLPSGVAIGTSNSIPDRLTNVPLPWSLTLLEQTCHFWNGSTLQRIDYREKWFENGVNHYYAWKMAVSMGLVKDEDALALLEGYLDAYLGDNRAGKLSMREAGLYRSPGLVTGGGFAVAFALDIQIKSLTQNRFSLDTLMKTMFKTRTGKPYDLGTIIDELRGITGHSFESFFESYVDGTAFLPLVHFMKKAGFHYELDPNSARVTITPIEASRLSL